MKKKDKPQSDNKNTTSNKDNKNVDKLSENQKNRDNKVQNTKGEKDMATISLDDEIVLDEFSARALAKKIEEDTKNNTVFEHINIQEKIKEGTEVLKRFLSH